MRVGISGLAAGNLSGLGRLCRVCLLALAAARPNWELHVYLRSPRHLELLREECDQASKSLPDILIPHFPALGGLNRLLLEWWDLPRRFAPLRLDAYLGLDFTLPLRPLAKREAAILPDLLPFTRPGTVGWRARLLYRRGVRECIRRKAALLCISESTRDALHRLFPEAVEARVIHPALSPKLAQLARQSAQTDRALQVRGSQAAMADPGPYILCVGALGPRKNVALLVEVYNALAKDGAYRGSLVIAGGDGRYHTAPKPRRALLQAAAPLLETAASTLAIHDLGRVNDYDLSQLYRGADLLVNLSAEEGFGFPVLEALAHGTPALVTEGSAMAGIASGGIATTPLTRERCIERLRSTLAALPLLRQEVRALSPRCYSIERLGEELAAAIEDKEV
ncbi:glycosyltransferase family 4 protein [bacterium]|nr:glycosyltransferase family 4 protein [bacterium]